MHGILETFRSMNVGQYIKFRAVYQIFISVCFRAILYNTSQKNKKTSLTSVGDIITYIYYNNTRLQCEIVLDTYT